jgi:predicted Zn-dependent peptidase
MKEKQKSKWLIAVFIAILTVPFLACQQGKENETTGFIVPVEYYKLPNGLKVILSQDKTAPTVLVAMYYNIGFRIEPKGLTGFAHLFEHLMFQGTKNMPKGEFDKIIERNGGINNGSTTFDFTNYFEVIPSHMLEPLLWVEADRMKGLDINQTSLDNQRGVVINEVKVNVLNQPYGGFPWLDMPQYANVNWYNAHNFYGDLADLEAAKLEDVESFFKTYYAPNNAALSVVGNFEIADAKKWVEKYFGNIPKADVPQIPDIKEPEQTEEKRFTKEDKLANKPAIAIAYKMPDRNTHAYYAMGLIDQLLLQGQDSKLYNLVVQEKGYTDYVSGGINYLGNMYNYNGPMIWMSHLIYDSIVPADSIIDQYDKAVASLDNITQDELDLAMVKIRSYLYSEVGGFFGVGRADMLAAFALFDDDPGRINNIESEFKKITPDIIRQTAKDYLRKTNRTILIVEPNSKNK